MKATILGVGRVLPLAALGLVAVLASGCGSASNGATPTHTVTVTKTSGSGATAPATPTPTSTTPAGPAECSTADLKVAVGSGNGAAGTAFYNLDFTNVSSATCFLQGYPGASLVSQGNSAGSQIGADAKRNPANPSNQLTLGPQQTAHAVLGVADAGNFPQSTCHIVTAHWLKVFPPDQTVAAYVSFTTQTCSSTAVPTMQITALSSGA